MPEARLRTHRLVAGFLCVFLSVAAYMGESLAARASTAFSSHSAASSDVQQTSVILDGVELSIFSPTIPNPEFSTTEPGSVSQVAVASTLNPFRELSITAVPFGTRPGTEALPIAQHGRAETYKNTLAEYRKKQGTQTLPGSAANLFGKSVTGQINMVELQLDSSRLKPILIAEWVTEAGQRLWLVRVAAEQGNRNVDTPQVALFLQSLQGLTITSSTLDTPSTLAPQSGESEEDSKQRLDLPPTSPSDLPSPSWWNGSDCDGNHFFAKSGRHSFRLGPVYQGMPACGPNSLVHGADTVIQWFFSGAHGVLEWECVELSMRFLYLAYSINPYRANGSQVVWNYSGTVLEQVSNGTQNKAPKPGDVLSYGSTSTNGHTSVVMESSVDSSGNGSITVIEQNLNTSGRSQLSVRNWVVSGNAGSVSGWLRRTGSPPAVPSNLTASATGRSSIHLHWDDNSNNEDGFNIYRNGSEIGRVGAGSRDYDDNGLSCGTQFTYYVKAYNGAGESGQSNSRSATTHDCPPPDSPSLDSPSDASSWASCYDMTFRWHGNGAEYQADIVGRYNRIRFAYRDWSSSISWDVDFGTLAAGEYEWSVRAQNRWGLSGWSSRYFTVNQNQRPGTPSHTSPAHDAWVNTRSPNLEWSAAGDDGCPNGLTYNVQIDRLPNASWGGSVTGRSGTSWAPSVPTDDDYRWRIQAFDGSLTSDWSGYRTVRVDATAPDTSLTSGPQGDIGVGNATFNWAGADNRTSAGALQYSYRLQGPGQKGDWSGWSTGTSIGFNGLSAGSFTIEVKARDLAGNEDPSPPSRSFFIDLTPPDTSITAGPTGCIATRNVTFTWTGADNRTATNALVYSYQLVGFDSAWSSYGASISKGYTNLPEGPYTFRVKAKDGVLHEDPSPAQRAMHVDTKPPTGTLLVNGGDSTTNQIAVQLTINASDGPLGCGLSQMRLGNDNLNYGVWRSMATLLEWNLPAVDRTTWTVHLQLKDIVGNVSAAVTDSIYLNFYPLRPSSSGYQMGARTTGAVDPEKANSTNFRLLNATMGQPIANGRVGGSIYRIFSGFQGGSLAVPRGRMENERFDTRSSVVDSAGGVAASASYRLLGVTGQPAAGGRRATSPNYGLVSGFLSAPLGACQVVSFTNTVNVSVNGNNLTKTGATGWNAGASSTATIQSGDGAVEATVARPADYMMIGLSKADVNQHYNSIEYAIYTYPPSGRLVVYERGVNRGSFAAYVPGDILRVAVEGGKIKYYRNGILFYTSGTSVTSSSFPLRFDGSIYTQGGQIRNVRICGGRLPGAPTPTPTPVLTCSPVSWTAAMSVTVSANTIQKSSTSSTWNAGAVSNKAIRSGNGYVEAEVNSSAEYVMFGLSRGNSGQNYTDIDFAIYTNPGNTPNRLYIIEGGISRGIFGSYNVGDVLRVAVENGKVKYYRNAGLLWTSGATITPASYPLLLDSSLYTPNSKVKDAYICGGPLAPSSPEPDDEREPAPVELPAKPIEFLDVDPSDSFFEAIQYLSARGVLSGYDDGTFRPSAPISRGQLVKVLVLAEGWDIVYAPILSFKDVDFENLFYPYVETAAANGFAVGYSDGTFRPHVQLTRGQLVQLLVLSLPWPREKSSGQHFKDVPPNSPFYEFVESAYQRGLIDAGDGIFRPDDNATRGQASEMVYRAIMANAKE